MQSTRSIVYLNSTQMQFEKQRSTRTFFVDLASSELQKVKSDTINLAGT